MNFIFIFYLVGLLIAVFQDIKRREIDDWLNLFLFFSGIGFLFFYEQLFFDYSIITFGFFIFVACMLSFILYYSRFFSGGDAKLLFSMSPMFFSVFFYVALSNLLTFVACLTLCGCIYSMAYALVLFFRDFNQTRAVFLREIKKRYSIILFILGFILILVGFFYKILILFGMFLFLFICLFAFARSLEAVSMKKNISTKNLREGDWLFYDLKIGGKKFNKNWDGLSEGDVNFLKKFNKKIFIKDGIPYAPAFFMSLILYYFSSYLLGIIFP